MVHVKYLVLGWIVCCICLPAYAQPAIGRSNTILINFGYPNLVVENSPAFNDVNDNNTIDVGENVMIRFKLQNQGDYTANRVVVRTRIDRDIQGLILPEPIVLGNIAPGGNAFPKILIKSDSTLASGIANLKFDIIENGDSAGVITYSVNTADVVQKARLSITSHVFIADSNQIRPDKPFILRIDLQNLGNATAEDVSFDFVVPNQVLVDTDLDKQIIKELKPMEIKELRFKLLAGINYKDVEIPIVIMVKERTGESEDRQTLEARVIQRRK